MTEKRSFIRVDDLMPQISLSQAAAFYGVTLPDLKRVGSETRTACFLQCGKSQETGDRALSIQEGHPAKQWHCHQYGCNKGGNLVALCDLMKPGVQAGGRPRGERFKDIAADIKAMAEGVASSGSPTSPPPPAAQPKAEVKRNVALKDSENERARSLTELDRKFVTDVAAMPPKASAYFRRRPFLSPEVCRIWRMGYLPRDKGEDNSGGTMRGKVVYPYFSEAGDLLTWFGRDPEFEDKHQKWVAGGRADREPEKFHFVKGFHRGLELFGQNRLMRDDVSGKLKGLGLVLVEGPNDVIRLGALDVPAVALCSNTITREQAAKVARLARTIGGGIVTVLLDCDPEGLNGMRQCLGYLAQLAPVRLAWTDKMFGGKFRGRQPESLALEDWQEITEFLRTGRSTGWSLE